MPDIVKQKRAFSRVHTRSPLMQRPLNTWTGRLWGFLQLLNYQRIQKVIVTSFVHLQKIHIFKKLEGIAKQLSLPRPFQFWTSNGCGRLNFKATTWQSEELEFQKLCSWSWRLIWWQLWNFIERQVKFNWYLLPIEHPERIL